MTGRNEACPCGSGKRYKHCHGAPGQLPAGPPEPTATASTLTQAGIEAHRSGDLDSAEHRYRAALALEPAYPPALHYLGMTLYQRGRLAEALPLLDQAVALRPSEAEFHSNRGLALHAAQRDAEAVAAHRRAVELRPDHFGALSNLGLALQASGDVDGAIDAFRRGLAISPEFPQLHWNLALALLLRGDYDGGWREYEWRLRTPELAATLRRYEGPSWTGDDPAGRTILVTAEQGLGDAIQHLRFAQALADRGARVVGAMPPALRSLAATVRGMARVVSVGEALPAYDAHVPLMSLPGRLGITLDDVHATVPYLTADPALTRAAAEIVGREAGSSLAVGVAWAGAPGNTQNARRSVPLPALAPLLAVPGVRLFSLKREGEAVEPADQALARQLVALDLRNDFDGLAALVAALDVIVTVDTSLAHLAGALGKPVLVLLARVPDWRWLLDRTDSPWYPTAQLFRQVEAGDWTVPVREVSAALAARATARAR